MESRERGLGVTVKEIAEQVRAQDNRITENPIFVVQQKIRYFGYDRDHADNFVYWRDGNQITDPEQLKLIADEIVHRGFTNTIQSYYIDRWEFVTACFTEKGCEDYLRQNGYNLKEPRIYVESGYRNDEWRTIREYLKAMI